MNVCLILGLIVRLTASHLDLELDLDWIGLVRGPEQAQAAENGLSQVFAGPPAKWRWAERHGGNAVEGEFGGRKLGATYKKGRPFFYRNHFVCDFVISG